MDQSLIGKKVAFRCDGWGEYAVKKRDEIMILDDDTDLKYAVDAFVNPLTALCLRRMILQTDHRSIVLDGASSHLCRTLI
jgi:NADPH:quinone reductase-like Zn-dependent oxidoreductase